MSPRRTTWALAFSLALAASPAARGQANAPHLGYVYPAGGQRGTTVQIVVGGQFLEGARRVLVAGGGASATLGEHVRPLNAKEVRELREKADALRKKSDSASLRELATVRRRLATAVRPANPAISETVAVELVLAPDAAPGQRELRLVTAQGLTNPVAFVVDELPEVRERPPAATRPFATTRPFAAAKKKAEAAPKADAPAPPTEFTLPAVLNGQVLPGGIDRFRFQARAGQKLVAIVSARALTPYLPDAVPGWFQATLALFDAKGKEVAYSDDYQFDPDPVLAYDVPANGTYTLEIKDAVYRGREDFVYRIAVGELPFVTGLSPLGGRAGREAAVSLRGWNLPADRLTVPAADALPGVVRLSLEHDGRSTNAMPFLIDDLPETADREANDSPTAAQPVTLPVVVTGKIDRAGDRDVFAFKGRAGETVVAEVMARRLESPVDSTLELTDATGRRLAFNDDHEDRGTGLVTHHADSLVRVTLPSDGTYLVHLSDAQQTGGDEHAYRLRLSAPRPGFDLRVSPSSVVVRGGASVPLTVHALRKDGFAGPIRIALKGRTSGFTLAGAVVPAEQDQVRLTLAAPSAPTDEPALLVLEGRATVGGRELVRPVVPADDLMQAFAYRHLVAARELRVAVVGRGFGPGQAAMRAVAPDPLKLPAGGTVAFDVSTPSGAARLVKLGYELSDPPDGITIQKTASTPGGTRVVLACDASKAKPGLAGNLIVNVFAQREGAAPKKKAATRRPPPVAVLPAIPFEVVAPKAGG